MGNAISVWPLSLTVEPGKTIRAERIKDGISITILRGGLTDRYEITSGADKRIQTLENGEQRIINDSDRSPISFWEHRGIGLVEKAALSEVEASFHYLEGKIDGELECSSDRAAKTVETLKGVGEINQELIDVVGNYQGY